MAEYSSWDVFNVRLPADQHPTSALEEITKGARNLRAVAIRYRSENDEVTERLVEPYEFKNGKFYGFDIGKAGIRAFKISNILAAMATDRAYEPRWAVLIDTPYYGGINS